MRAVAILGQIYKGVFLYVNGFTASLRLYLNKTIKMQSLFDLNRIIY